MACYGLAISDTPFPALVWDTMLLSEILNRVVILEVQSNSTNQV